MISVMDADAVTGYENRKVLNARLVAYQTQLLSIAKEIEFLKKLENPQSINELLSSIYHNTQDLLDSFKKDPYSDPYKIISRYQELDFLGGVKLLYREVMNMITNPNVVLE
jgi:hypothetical protein